MKIPCANLGKVWCESPTFTWGRWRASGCWQSEARSQSHTGWNRNGSKLSANWIRIEPVQAEEHYPFSPKAIWEGPKNDSSHHHPAEVGGGDEGGEEGPFANQIPLCRDCPLILLGGWLNFTSLPFFFLRLRCEWQGDKKFMIVQSDLNFVAFDAMKSPNMILNTMMTMIMTKFSTWWKWNSYPWVHSTTPRLWLLGSENMLHCSHSTFHKMIIFSIIITDI